MDINEVKNLSTNAGIYMFTNSKHRNKDAVMKHNQNSESLDILYERRCYNIKWGTIS